MLTADAGYYRDIGSNHSRTGKDSPRTRGCDLYGPIPVPGPYAEKGYRQGTCGIELEKPVYVPAESGHDGSCGGRLSIRTHNGRDPAPANQRPPVESRYVGQDGQGTLEYEEQEFESSSLREQLGGYI